MDREYHYAERVICRRLGALVPGVAQGVELLGARDEQVQRQERGNHQKHMV